MPRQLFHLRLILLLLAAGIAGQAAADEAAGPATAKAADRPIPYKQSTAEEEALPYRVLGAMLLVGGLLYAGAYVAKRFGWHLGERGKQNGRLAVQERLRISPRTTLVVVRYGKSELLVAETPAGISLLKEQPVPGPQSESADA